MPGPEGAVKWRVVVLTDRGGWTRLEQILMAVVGAGDGAGHHQDGHLRVGGVDIRHRTTVSAHDLETIDMLVIDPVFAGASNERLAELLKSSTRRGAEHFKVVFHATPSHDALSRVLAMAHMPQGELAIHGLDDQALADEIMSGGVVGPETARLHAEFHERVARLSPRGQMIWNRLVEAAASENVKSVAAFFHVSRRTIERTFSSVGLPSPAAVSRAMREARRRDLQQMTDASRSRLTPTPDLP